MKEQENKNENKKNSKEQKKDLISSIILIILIIGVSIASYFLFNNDKKEKRRHYSLEACTYEGEDFIDETTPENIFEQKCEDINISHILFLKMRYAV